MSQSLLPDNAAAASSSESSESEDEKARKIREAVGDPNWFVNKTDPKPADSAINKPGKTDSNGLKKARWKAPSLQSSSTNGNGQQFKALKSNRPAVDRNEDDDDNVLKTTPEFRSYVAKQLSQMLDRDLDSSCIDQLWSSPCPKTQCEMTGIKLFSDSKTLCTGEKKKVSTPTAASSTTAANCGKKRRLSTSSESSDDDKIQSCVFTVTDIQQENHMLARLQEPAVSNSEKTGNDINTTTANGASNLTTIDRSESAQHQGDGIKKKKKKKKSKKKETFQKEGIT